MLTKHTDHNARAHVLFDDGTPAARYTIIFEGREDVVIAQPFESAAATWQRVLARLAENRSIIRHGAWRGREFHYATIFAGIEPTDEDRKEHMRDWISACLYQMADPARNKDAESRVQALIALSELHGLNQPRAVHVVTLPTLEQIEAEIARREVQQ